MDLQRPSATGLGRPTPATTAVPKPAPAGWWTVDRLTWGMVALGVLLRLARYLQRFPLWHDEAFLAVNFLDRDFGDLLRPLDYLQVAPPLFLVVELAVVKAVGFSEWSLRLVPTLAGVASLVVLRDLARRLAGPRPALVAVGFLAVSYSPLRHANEVKPYATDLLVACLLLALAARWLDRPGRAGWLVALAVVTPAAVFLSLPAAFVAGGAALALAPRVVRVGTARERLALAACWGGLGLGVAGVTALSAANPMTEVLRDHYLLIYWSGSFPPWRDGPAALLGWLVRIHAGNLLAYPVGGEAGASAGTLGLVVVGIAVLARRREGGALALLLLPFGLNLAAAGLAIYPYGGEARIAQHLAPSACLLAGIGVARLTGGPRATIGRAVALIGLVGLGQFLAGVVAPYHLESSARGRAFARWFWVEQGRGAELLCLKSDVGRDLEPYQWVTGVSAEYLCNRAIYAGRGGGRGFVPPAPDRPTRVVIYQVDAFEPPWDKPAFGDWVDPIRRRYRLDRIETHRVGDGVEPEDWKRERYHVLQFVAGAGPAGPDALDRLRVRRRAAD